MIYGYLRVSSDDQDVNSQKQGVDKFAEEHNYIIDEYISDEGVSGGKDPDKRKLGPLLQKLKEKDIVIASEISRLGRDLFMVMDILHFCMKQGVVIYTVKDRFTLGNDIQSKVLAFAFGLSAEIERQMIRQRTTEGLRRRMMLGVLLGRPLGKETCEERRVMDEKETKKAEEFIKIGFPQRMVAKVLGIDRNTLTRALIKYNSDVIPEKTKDNSYVLGLREKQRKLIYEDLLNKGDIVELDPKVKEMILKDRSIPDIAKEFPDFTYNQIYTSIAFDDELNNLYREHAQKWLLKANRMNTAVRV